MLLTAHFLLVTMEAIMTIAPTLQEYLDQNITYEVIPHEPTMSSMRTAEVCHISGDNTEFCLLATRGAPMRLAMDVNQLIVTPVGEHSAKPEESRERIERLYAGTTLSCSPAIRQRAGLPGAMRLTERSSQNRTNGLL
jgi:N6-adenosine-specific RNA methylase IME4